MRRHVLCQLVAAACAISTAIAGRVDTIDGRTYRGEVRFEGPAVVQVTPKDAAPVRLQLAEVIYAAKSDAETAGTVRPGAMLRNGICLSGSIDRLDLPKISFPRLNLDVPADQIAAVILSDAPISAFRQARRGARGVLLPTGDLFEGEVKSITADHVTVMNELFGLRKFSRKQGVSGVVLRDVERVTWNYQIGTADGSTFPVDNVHLGEGISVDIPGAGTLRVPAADIDSVAAGPGVILRVADLPPAQVNPAKGFNAGKTLDGMPITLGEEKWENGIHMAAGTIVTYGLPAGFTVLNARIALTPGQTSPGPLTFTVLADQRPVFRGSPAAGASITPIRVVLGPARSFTLRIDGPANSSGTGLWLEPILLRR
jgi:hypothetical protein